MNLLKAALSVSSMTLLSRITGLARDVLINTTFGVSAATDAFNVAFRIPNMLRRFFAEGAFSQAFVPVMAEAKNAQGAEATKALVDRVASLLFVALVLVTALGTALAPLVVYATAWGFADDASKFELTVQLLRWTFPYILFISMVALSAGILNSFGRFKGPAFTPVLLNLSFIGAILFVVPRLKPDLQIHALAWGAFAGGVLQLLFQIPQLMRIGMLPRFKWDPAYQGVKRILALMLPATLGVSVAQVSLLINTQIASHLADGSVTWLSNADRLMEFPTALLGVALGTVILPSLVKHKTDNNPREFSRLIDWGLRLTVLLAIPAAVGLAMLATPLLATLFWHGKFQQIDVARTQAALIGYCVGLLGLIAVKVLAPGFYARQDIKTPVYVAIAALVITQLANAVLVPRYQHAALAMSISIGALANALVLLILLKRRGHFTPEPEWAAFLVKVIAAVYIMAGVLWFTAGSTSSWFALTASGRIIKLAWVVPLAAATYFAALAMMGVRWTQFVRREK